MAYTIRLTPEDQRVLIEELAINWQYKVDKKLRREDSIKTMSLYYIDAIEKISENRLQVNHPKKNIWLWIIDQLNHSSTSQWSTPSCQKAIEICQQALDRTYKEPRYEY